MSSPPHSFAVYSWLAARTRNALRRRVTMSIAAGVTLIVALLGFVLIPRQASRIAQEMTQSLPERPDTMQMIRMAQSALASIIGTDSLLADARRRLAQPPVPAPLIDTISPSLRGVRDSLRQLLGELDSLRGRASESPFPPAFRALAESRAMRWVGDSRRWLDSLDRLETQRLAYEALGANDPTYIALTARLNEVGRLIRDAASLRHRELRARLAPLLPVRPPPVPRYQIDTMPLLGDKIRAQRLHGIALDSLVKLRTVNTMIDSTMTMARQLGNLGAPPSAILGAAIVIALAAGFGVAFLGELKQPRIAHVREAETIAGERVLTVIRPSREVGDEVEYRGIGAPPVIDAASQSYQTLYLHLAATGAMIPVVTVTGDHPRIVSTIAATLATVAERESRTTLFLDEFNEPGTVAQQDFLRLKRQYDFIVIAAPLQAFSTNAFDRTPESDAIPRDAMVLCARVGSTRLASYQSAIRMMRNAMAQSAKSGLRGVVLWEDTTPNYG